MKCLWSIFLVAVLLVDWLDCSPPPSKDPGTRRRKNKLRSEGSSTTATQSLELHDLLNVSTTPTTVASSRSSSQEKPDVSKNEKAEQHPIEETNVESKIEVIPFGNNITKAEDNDDRRLASADLSRGTLTSSSSSSQGRPSENDKKETKGRETITLSSPLSTTSSSLSSDNIITTRRNDSAITTYTSTASTTPTVITSTLPSKTNVTGNLTAGFTQRCPSEQGGDCVSSTVTSSSSSSSSSSSTAAAASTASGGRVTIADAAAPNSHPASSLSSSSSQTPSGLTQQPASSSWGDQAAVAGVAAVGEPSAQARTAACSPCDVRQCQPVFPESCDGLIRKDVCGCCPICSSYEDAGTGMVMVTTSVGVGGGGGNVGANVCDSIRCPRGRVCLLNIQGLPMCRCPSVFHCRRLPDRPICSTDGRTFKNRCFIGVEECVSSRTLGIAHDGRCGEEVMGMMMMVTTHASPSSAIRSQTQHTQFLMSDERVRHQGYRVRNNRQRQHRRQKQTRGGELHERQPQHTDGAAVAAAGDKRRPDAPQAKRKSSQGQRD